jgi:phage-related baseplate assembly protein
MSNFDSLQFTETNARVIERKLNAFYEALRRASGETDYQINQDLPMVQEQATLAAGLTQVNVDIDQTGKQNLLYFANGQNLDALGDLYGARGNRLQASYAACTMQYNLQAIRGVDTPIPAGSRVTADNQLFFATLTQAIIPAGQLSATITAQCQTAGDVGNNYDVGDLSSMVDLIPFVVSASNITAPTGGGDSEEDDQYRNRIRQVPESFSVAGPDGAYEFWALQTDPSIIDAKAYMPNLEISSWQTLLWNFLNTNREASDITEDMATAFYNAWGRMVKETGTGPGNVNVAILCKDGTLPSPELLDKVYANLTNPDQEKRPLTDFLHIISPEQVHYNIKVNYEVSEGGDNALIYQNIVQAIQRFVNYQKTKLGISLNNSMLRDFLTQAGAYRVEVLEPAYTVLEPYQFAVLDGDPIINGFEEAKIKG